MKSSLKHPNASMQNQAKAAAAGPNAIAVATTNGGESFSGFSQNDARVDGNAPETVQLQALPPTTQGMSTFPFVDQRPEANQVAQLQAMADNQSVIQRKPLNAALLNVVGENHDTSGELRMWETEYAEQKTKGKYWQEDEFKVQVAKPGKEDETVEVFGDPQILQMANIIYLSTSALLNIAKYLTDIGKVKANRSNLSMSRMQVFSKCDIIKNRLPWIKNFAGTYKKIKRKALAELPNRPDLQATYDFYSTFGDTYFDNFGPGLELWISNTLQLDRNRTNEVQLNLAIQNSIPFGSMGNQLMNNLFKKDSATFEENQAEMNKIIFRRSQSMHDAAILGRTTKGVWKIGETHVKDIKKILQDASPTYELMTEEEFFADFRTWLVQSPIYQGFEYGMELAEMYDWSERTVFEKAKAGEFNDMVQSRKDRAARRESVPTYIS